MQAYTYIEKGKFALLEKAKPTLIDSTDAIVKVTLESICTSDLHIKHGSVPRAVPGITVGHEMVGIVEEVGSEVTAVKVGDRVTVNVETFCGECFYCKNGYVNNCTSPHGGWALGCRIDGGQTEYVRVPLANQGLNRIPEGVTDEQALFVGDILATGFWAARISEISTDDTVLIIGAGPTGICALLCVMLKHPKRIIVCEQSAERRAFVKAHYPDVLLTTPEECSDFVMQHSDHGGADRVLEVAGGKNTIQLTWQCARPNAIVTIVALYDEPQLLPLPQMYGKNLTFKTGGVDGCDCEEILQLIKEGKIDTTPLITHRFPLERIAEACEIFEQKRDGVIKVAIYNKDYEKNKIEIISVSNCLRKNLSVPEYQRPYKWGIQNITDLLLDIEHAISENRLYSDFKYRVGTVILHEVNNNLHIVDGQQRIISLTLLNHYLDAKFDNSILSTKFTDNTTLKHINENYHCIKEWFSLRTQDEKTAFINAMKDILEVVIIYVDKESEAFQLFDSQNTRGRALDPHDLLKAYHLREMRGSTYDMEYAVNKWEEKNVAQIRELFRDYLFPVWNWSRGRKTWTFTDKDIDTYKGVSIDCPYTFARRTFKAMPYFQITEPFVAGSDFFEMVDHYLQLMRNIESELRKQDDFAEIRHFLEEKHCSIGMKHVRKLFKAAILLYYDRFHQLDPLALKKLFMWAFMLRIELDNLSFDSVNKYAVGDGINNSIPIFSLITQARKHVEIGNIIINIPEDLSCRNCVEERNMLHKLLDNMKHKGF